MKKAMSVDNVKNSLKVISDNIYKSGVEQEVKDKVKKFVES